MTFKLSGLGTKRMPHHLAQLWNDREVFQLQKYLCNFTNPGENNEKLVRGMSL